nr:MAG TPA: hypothetical protein [Caudoviricetes sp.]DAU39386.1 MAG TPA: hypothetical protein [Caudoviricetes sp.]
MAVKHTNDSANNRHKRSNENRTNQSRTNKRE